MSPARPSARLLPGLLPLLLLGCTDPGPVALEACAAVPQLATDAAGLALLEPLLAREELRALKAAAPTRGLAAVGEAGMARLRAEARCELKETNGAGSGRWQVLLSRTIPAVAVDGSIGAPETYDLDWQVVDEGDGLRVEAGTDNAERMRASVESARAENDFKRVGAGWRALRDTFRDPVLTVDADYAHRIDLGWEYRQNLVPGGLAADGVLLSATVTNQGDQAVAHAVLELSWELDGAAASKRIELRDLAPGQSAPLQAEVARALVGDDPGLGKVDVQAKEIELAPAG
jgi:hypothetical protein